MASLTETEDWDWDWGKGAPQTESETARHRSRHTVCLVSGRGREHARHREQLVSISAQPRAVHSAQHRDHTHAAGRGEGRGRRACAAGCASSRAACRPRARPAASGSAAPAAPSGSPRRAATCPVSPGSRLLGRSARRRDSLWFVVATHSAANTQATLSVFFAVSLLLPLCTQPATLPCLTTTTATRTSVSLSSPRCKRIVCKTHYSLAPAFTLTTWVLLCSGNTFATHKKKVTCRDEGWVTG